MCVVVGGRRKGGGESGDNTCSFVFCLGVCFIIVDIFVHESCFFFFICCYVLNCFGLHLIYLHNHCTYSCVLVEIFTFAKLVLLAVLLFVIVH